MTTCRVENVPPSPPPESSEFATKDYITLALAAWGAVLSTVLGIRTVQRDKPRVKIKTIALADASDMKAGIRDLWHVRIVNVRPTPIEIEQVGLTVKHKEFDSYVPTLLGFDGNDPPFTPPLVIKHGESASFYFERNDQGMLGKVSGAWARDTLDREHVQKMRRWTPKALRERWRTWWMNRQYDKAEKKEKRRAT